MRVLVIGSGGREHAIVRACLRSSLVGEVLAAPGNGGMARDVRCVQVDIMNPEAVLALVREAEVDFVIVGPEAPLSIGLVDALESAGVLAYGTNQAATRLEASKAYCKDFLQRHGIPTAAYASFTEIDPALTYLKQCRYPVVVKASGLAAGKGVIIAQDEPEAVASVRGMLDGTLFGESGREVVVESFLEGEEASIMLMVCRDRYVALPPSQDHKRVGEGDSGPNTGGMGAYAPAAVVDETVQRRIREEIIEPTLAGLRCDGIDYRGTLYIGIMITDSGPQVVEFNTRFGDPELQVLLPLCETDPVGVMLACARGTLDGVELHVREGAAIVVVLAATGYPGEYERGESIELPDALPENVEIVHAGTQLDDGGTLRSAGGRVLGVTAFAPTLKEAAARAYAVCEQIRWPGKYYRRDIGVRQLTRERCG